MSNEIRSEISGRTTQPNQGALSFEVVEAAALPAAHYGALLDLCTRAYEKHFAPYLEPLVEPTHVLAYYEGTLVAHALWVTRWLQIGESPLLRTAYVEAVATEPAYQGRGFASALMRHLVTQVQAYDLAALGPSDPAFYTRLGWQLWRGPLFVRTARGVELTPGERVMVHALPNSLPLDLDAPISVEWRPGEIW